MTVQLTPTLCGQWGLRGQQPLIPCLARSNQKVHLFGGLNPISGKIHYRKAPTINALHFQWFLTHLLRRYPSGILIVILDRAVWHRARSLKPFFAMHPRLKLFFLPPYSPDMNPTEQLWRVLRREVTHNHFFEVMPKLKKALDRFFQRKRNLSFKKNIQRWSIIC